MGLGRYLYSKIGSAIVSKSSTKGVGTGGGTTTTIWVKEILRKTRSFRNFLDWQYTLLLAEVVYHCGTTIFVQTSALEYYRFSCVKYGTWITSTTYCNFSVPIYCTYPISSFGLTNWCFKEKIWP